MSDDIHIEIRAGARAAVEAVIAMLDDPDPVIRLRATLALAKWLPETLSS